MPNTTLEGVGPKPTKSCIECDTGLHDDNWYPSFVEKRHYKCKTCYDIRRLENKLKAKGMSKRGLLKLYKLKSRMVYDKFPTGHIYVLKNPAWPDWVKVGKAVDALDRLNSYQTASPNRDYSVIHFIETQNRHAVEKAAHIKLNEACTGRHNEWFRISNDTAISILNNFRNTG
jgi:hypothetical protein